MITVLDIHNYEQKERNKRTKKREKGWNDHTRLGAGCTQTMPQ